MLRVGGITGRKKGLLLVLFGYGCASAPLQISASFAFRAGATGLYSVLPRARRLLAGRGDGQARSWATEVQMDVSFRGCCLAKVTHRIIKITTVDAFTRWRARMGFSSETP